MQNKDTFLFHTETKMFLLFNDWKLNTSMKNYWWFIDDLYRYLSLWIIMATGRNIIGNFNIIIINYWNIACNIEFLTENIKLYCETGR